ncbi:MAG: ROK family protein [Actinobacteria bacterium]|nr:ROK family protein [Actinomycetota bacterium]
MTETVGVDVGGTKMLGVVVSDDGSVVRSARRPTPDAGGLLAGVAGLVAELQSDGSVGIGVAGMVTHEGVLRSSPNLPGVADLDVRGGLQAMLGRRVVVDNDATCGLAAEWMRGAAVGARDAWLVTLGTGIGGGFLSGGAIQRGGQGFAGEIGHMVVQRGGTACPCGRFGCWERYASGTALVELAGGGAGGIVHGSDVLGGAASGDARLRAVVDEWTDWIALGVSNLANATDPDLVVLGGGAGSDPAVAAAVSDALRGHLYAPSHRRVPRVVAARCGEQAGAIGAALLARD